VVICGGIGGRGSSRRWLQLILFLGAPCWATGQSEAVVGTDSPETSPSRLIRVRAYEAVQAVLSDDHNYERGVQAARAVAHAVLAEAGPVALAEMAVELSLKLGEALELMAGDEGFAAVDLAEVWFVD